MARNNKKINERDTVIIGYDNWRRINWPLSKIVEVYPGEDGIVSVAKVKMKNGFR